MVILKLMTSILVGMETFRGKLMNSGTYIWYVEVEYIDGARQAFKGETSLIR